MGIRFWLGWSSGKKQLPRAPRRRHSTLRIESLEDRLTPSVTIQLDYSHNTNGTFFTPTVKSVLQQAANDLGSRLGDSLSAIQPGGGNSWSLDTFDPTNPSSSFSVSNLSIPANTIIVYIGASTDQKLGGALGIGGPGGWNANGSSQSWFDTVGARGQSGALLASPTDFGPWGGTVTFNADYTDWFFGTSATGIGFNQVDFYSVAEHELGHVLGFGTADSWHRLVSGSVFVGANAVKEFGGNVPVDAPGLASGHWADNTLDHGVHADMDPVAENGLRTAFTALDFAGLRDMGWQVMPATPTMLTPSGTTTTTTPQFTWTSFPGAVSYTLEVDDSQGNVVFSQSGINATSFIPSTPLNDQVIYTVKVEAFDGAGATGGFGKALTFTVKVPQTAALPFSDTFGPAFDSRLSPQWTVPLGDYLLSANQAGANVTGINLAVLNDVSQGDVTVSAMVNRTVSGAIAGLVARYQGTGDKNMYLGGVLNNNGIYTAGIWKNVNGTWTKLTSVTLTSAQFNGTGMLRLDAVGTNLRLFVNGTVVAAAVDASFSTGSVGIRSNKGVKFSNFNADAVTLQLAALPFSDSFSATTDNQLAPTWINQRGNFSLQTVGGIPMAVAGIAGPNVAVLNGITLGDVSMSVGVNGIPSGTIAALVARYQGIGDRNMYMAGVLNSNGLSIAGIWKNVSGTWTTLTSVTLTAAQFKGTGTLRFDAVGTNLRFFVNGTVVAAAVDATFSTGSVGIRSSKGDKFSAFNVAAVTLQPASLPFPNSFTATSDNQLGPNWINQKGNFGMQIVNSTPVAVAGIAGMNVATLFGLNQADVSVAADVSNLASGTIAGLVARYQGIGDRNMYMAGVHNVNGVYTAEIWKNVNGTWTKLKSKTLTAAQFSGAGTIQFVATGSTLELSVNGVLATSATDTTFASGMVGIRGSKGVQFSTFSAS